MSRKTDKRKSKTDKTRDQEVLIGETGTEELSEEALDDVSGGLLEFGAFKYSTLDNKSAIGVKLDPLAPRIGDGSVKPTKI